MVERLSSDRKLNPDEAEENTDQYMDGEDWLSQGFQTHFLLQGSDLSIVNYVLVGRIRNF